MKSELVAGTLTVCKILGLPAPLCGPNELMFHPVRKWRFDISWPDYSIAVECDGGSWARKGAKKCPVCHQIPKGRHSGGKGFEDDCEKFNEAAILGWRVFHFTAHMIKDGRALSVLERAFNGVERSRS